MDGTPARGSSKRSSRTAVACSENDREVHPLSVPCRPERVRRARPDPHPWSPSRSVPVRNTRNPQGPSVTAAPSGAAVGSGTSNSVQQTPPGSVASRSDSGEVEEHGDLGLPVRPFQRHDGTHRVRHGAFAGRTTQRCLRGSQRHQRPVELPQVALLALVAGAPVQYGAGEGLRVGGVRDVTGHGQVLGQPAAPHRLEESGVTVIDEVGERGGLAVLLTHEEEGDAGRQQQQRCGEPEPGDGHE